MNKFITPFFSTPPTIPSIGGGKEFLLFEAWRVYDLNIIKEQIMAVLDKVFIHCEITKQNRNIGIYPGGYWKNGIPNGEMRIIVPTQVIENNNNNYFFFGYNYNCWFTRGDFTIWDIYIKTASLPFRFYLTSMEGTLTKERRNSSGKGPVHYRVNYKYYNGKPSLSII